MNLNEKTKYLSEIVILILIMLICFFVMPDDSKNTTLSSIAIFVGIGSLIISQQATELAKRFLD